MDDLRNEKNTALNILTQHVQPTIDDDSMLTHDMLEAIISKCQELIMTDF